MSSVATVATDDPTSVPPPRNALERRAASLLRDERDIAFVRVMARITVCVIPAAVTLFLLPTWVTLLLAAPYLALLFVGFGGPYVLMLHAMCHRPTFRKPYRWMEHYVPWVLGPFFGSTPTSFFAHHMGMHHPENNLMPDASSTLCYQRDRPLHFLHYWARFFFVGTAHLHRYLSGRGRHKLARRLLVGEAAWYLAIALLLLVNPVATLVVFVAPLCLLRTVMMCGNWAQHAFVDVDDPDNAYRNSTNLIRTPYNHRCYNDGYHIVHHLYPALHWTEMPGRYERDLEKFHAQDALVFDGIRNNQQMFWLLMFQNWDRIAEALVRAPGDDRSHEQIVAMLQDRARRSHEPIRGLLDFGWNPAWDRLRVRTRSAGA